MPPADLSPLSATQETQLAQLLRGILANGSGRLEIRVERHSPKWFRPCTPIYSPILPSAPHYPTRPGDPLGAWRDAFDLALRQLMGSSHGSLFIQVEHGQIRCIEPVPDVRVRTGQTAPLGAG